MSIISKTKFLEFKSAKSPSNKDWYYVRRINDTPKHDSAVVITTLVKKDNEYNFLLIKTVRPPLYAENKSKYCLESPAGLIGDKNCSESMIECAKKELLEEAGLVADEIYVELENSATSAGLTSETLSYVSAIVNEYKLKSTPVDDGGIIKERFLVPANKIHDYLKTVDSKETSIAAATICGIFYAMNRIK
ncbi:NUDIX hydrolase [bacterium]|nr:NUDIX hydrolase [bacterium]